MTQIYSPPCEDTAHKAHARTIVLVGMMGAGKTTIGRRLAPKLNRPFVDADEEIERAAGMSVADLFKEHGEESFRRGEAQVIRRLLEGAPIVLATGGGALTNEETRALVKAHGYSIWLRAAPELLARRATQRGVRPLLKNGDPEAIIRRLLKEREDHYKEADLIIDSKHAPHSRTVDAILQAIGVTPETDQDTNET